MGGASCQIIIRYFRTVFEDPEFYAFFADEPNLKVKVDEVLAKPYSQWREHDVDTLFHAWKEIFKEYEGQYTD